VTKKVHTTNYEDCGIVGDCPCANSGSVEAIQKKSYEKPLMVTNSLPPQLSIGMCNLDNISQPCPLTTDYALNPNYILWVYCFPF